jgi:hypothetical protein
VYSEIENGMFRQGKSRAGMRRTKRGPIFLGGVNQACDARL